MYIALVVLNGLKSRQCFILLDRQYEEWFKKKKKKKERKVSGELLPGQKNPTSHPSTITAGETIL